MHRIPRNPKHGARLDMVPDPVDLNLPRPLEHVLDLCLTMLVQSECPVGRTGRDSYAHGVGAGARLGEECLPDHGTVFGVWERAEGCLADLIPIEDHWRILKVSSQTKQLADSIHTPYLLRFLLSVLWGVTSILTFQYSALPKYAFSAAAGLPGSSGRLRGVSSPRTVGTTFQPWPQNDPAIEDFGTPEDVLMAVVDSYFTYCQNQPYSFFHEETFRQGLAQQAIPKHLVLTVMATAVRFCSHPYYSGRALEMSVEYANRSWKLIVSGCFTVGKVAEVSTVQTVALLGLFDFTAGQLRHGSAWVKVGLAVRIAQDCGLMLENAEHLSNSQQDERRRVFWSVYTLDRLVSCGRGRPPAIVDASCHLQLPCDESIWREGLWAKTQSLDEMTNRTLSISQRQCPLAQVIAIAQILGRCAQYVLQDFNIRGPHPPWDPGSDFAGIESDLLHFEAYLEIQRPIDEILSPYILAEGVVDSQSSGPIIFSRALFHLCYCLLNHPFLLRRRINTCRNLAPISFIKRSFDLAWLHAQQMMALIRESRKLGCSFHSSSSGYAVTVAGSIIALRTYDEHSPTSQEAQMLLDEALGYLDIIGHHWSNVRTMVTY
ncbi:zn 2cys6 transcription factor [Fusarium subglutinans]|uniref:Zn 2cys6 transcription factor n=1 Tax=Gibberella subglutinans TaxID=42677 RepID=A0A8H5Q027_GIBSU|nr:zn 2cys6 transcription factor [Fusarium subglutinans]KAF5606177.1 zn 2cys6 transcription factor [Fusarium subglutinans]